MELENQRFYKEVVELLNNARNKIKKNVDSVMTYTYYEVGRRIVEEEQKGKERAEYGRQLLVNLSKILIMQFPTLLKKQHQVIKKCLLAFCCLLVTKFVIM